LERVLFCEDTLIPLFAMIGNRYKEIDSGSGRGSGRYSLSNTTDDLLAQSMIGTFSHTFFFLNRKKPES
jgi:hypothetical protein